MLRMLKNSLVLCAMAVCFSAFSQQRPPKGCNYAIGDFNGDGKNEYVYFVAPQGADHWDELEDLSGLNGLLKFTDSSIPGIFIKQCAFGMPRNLGDLNDDGKDEIGIQPGWVTSSWQIYRIFTLQPQGWVDAVAPFTVWLGDEDTDFDANPPVAKLGNGKVRITYYEMPTTGDAPTPKTKVVKIK